MDNVLSHRGRGVRYLYCRLTARYTFFSCTNKISCSSATSHQQGVQLSHRIQSTWARWLFWQKKWEQTEQALVWLRKQEETALEGKPLEDVVNANQRRNRFARRPYVRIIACVSQQTTGRKESLKGSHILETVPCGPTKEHMRVFSLFVDYPEVLNTLKYLLNCAWTANIHRTRLGLY